MYTLTVLQQIIQLVHILYRTNEKKQQDNGAYIKKKPQRKEVFKVITLDLTGRAPIYEQICSQFSSLISKGVLKENDKLPSSRMLAKELGLNPNTVAKAYSRLEHDEIIYSVAGKGCFVAKQKGSIEKKLLEEFKLHAAAALQAGISLEALSSVLDELAEEQQERSDKK